MAEEKNPEQNAEPTAEERAQLEKDVLKAAQDAMNLEADGSASSPTGNNEAAEEAPKSDDEAADAKADDTANAKAEEQPAAPSAEEVLKQQLAESNDRFVRLMAEFENFRRRNAKEQLELIRTASSSKNSPKSRIISNALSPAKTRPRISKPSKKACR